MNLRTYLNTSVATLAAVCSSVTLAADPTDAMSVQTIWNAGRHYDTIVKMSIDISNATLTASEEYKGSYRLPHLTFKPVLRFYTDDIQKSGVNYYGKRTYEQPKQLVEGIEAIRWKSKHVWVDPRRWVAAWRMSHDKDIAKWKSENKELARQIEEKGVAVENYAVFYDDDHNPVGFDPLNDSLLLHWSESSVSNFHNGEKDDLIVKAYRADRDANSDAILNARGDLPRAGFEIQRKVVAECNTLASVLYDDPSGNRRSLLKNKLEWKINAGDLNEGLLFYGNMNSLINFEGTLTVRKEPISKEECKILGFDKPFDGDKIIVVNSKGAKVGYHVGGRWQPFRLTIDYARRDDPDANRMEFWFDPGNNVLRYARVRIVKEDYDGDIPNPRLGKAASLLKGTVKGRVAFDLEYWTAVDQNLPSLDE